MKLLRIDSSVRVEHSITSMLTDFFFLALNKHRALHNMDYRENYLSNVFSFLGFTDISFVHTEAQDFRSEQMQTVNVLRSKQTLLELSASW